MNDETLSPQVPHQRTELLSDRTEGSGRVVERLDDTAALRLLSGAPYGRVVFVRDGDVEIRPLSHIVDDGQVIVRTRPGAALAGALAAEGGARITFEADDLDVEARVGWSVIVSGTAVPVTEPERVAGYKRLLKTMLAGTDDTVIAIRPSAVTGIRIVPESVAGVAGAKAAL